MFEYLSRNFAEHTKSGVRGFWRNGSDIYSMLFGNKPFHVEVIQEQYLFEVYGGPAEASSDLESI